MSTIAFLGLGTMGTGMAGRLVDAGLDVVVWNRRRERADTLTARGARVGASPREAAGGAAFVISMVADDEASREVWLGDSGALAGTAPGTVLIESSTLSPEWIEALAREAASRGCELLDAPVTGSKTHAAAGQLLFLVGGSAATLERARPVLTPMSRGVMHLGPIGSGARMKLINNFVCGVQAAVLGEAVVLIERSGLDPAVAFSVLADGAPGSPLVKTVGPRMTSADYTVNFGLALMRKDLAYAMAEGERVGIPMHITRAARELFDRAIAAGLADVDFSAVVEPMRRA